MKKLKQNCRSLATLLSLVFLFGLFQSCSKREELANEIHELDLYSGEDIFRGLFFLEGDFVDQIPSLKQQRINMDALMESPMVLSMMKSKNIESKTEIETQIDNFKNKLTEEVKKIDPTIFGDLKKNITNGDVDLLERTMKQAAEVLNAAILQTEMVSKNVKLVDLAYKKDGISPNDYDLTTAEGIQKYNEKVIDFAKSENLDSKNLDDEQAGIIFVFLVVAYLFVAVAAYFFLAIGGLVIITIGGYLYIEIEADWGTGQDDVAIGTQKGRDNLEYKMMLAELINYAN